MCSSRSRLSVWAGEGCARHRQSGELIDSDSTLKPHWLEGDRGRAPRCRN